MIGVGYFFNKIKKMEPVFLPVFQIYGRITYTMVGFLQMLINYLKLLDHVFFSIVEKHDAK